MDDYVPPGFVRLIDHIEDVARAINPEIVGTTIGADEVKSELEADYRAYAARLTGSGDRLEDWATFAGPFAEGAAPQGNDLLAVQATTSQFIRYRNALDRAAAKKAEARRPVLLLAARQVRDELCTGKLCGSRRGAIVLEPAFWASPSADALFNPNQPENGDILIKVEGGVPGDGGERRFRTFLDERYVTLYRGKDKLTVYNAFKGAVDFDPTLAAMDRAWSAFSAGHPELGLSLPGRKAIRKSTRKSGQ
jgi:hypothetical protein